MIIRYEMINMLKMKGIKINILLKMFIDICLALLHYDGYKAGKLMLEQSNAASGLAEEGFCKSIQKIVERAKIENCFEHISDYITEILGLSCKYRAMLMPDIINVAMAVKVCEGIALSLNPELELAKVAIPVRIYIMHVTDCSHIYCTSDCVERTSKVLLE